MLHSSQDLQFLFNISSETNLGNQTRISSPPVNETDSLDLLKDLTDILGVGFLCQSYSIENQKQSPKHEKDKNDTKKCFQDSKLTVDECLKLFELQSSPKKFSIYETNNLVDNHVDKGYQNDIIISNISDQGYKTSYGTEDENLSETKSLLKQLNLIIDKKPPDMICVSSDNQSFKSLCQQNIESSQYPSLFKNSESSHDCKVSDICSGSVLIDNQDCEKVLDECLSVCTDKTPISQMQYLPRSSLICSPSHLSSEVASFEASFNSNKVIPKFEVNKVCCVMEEKKSDISLQQVVKKGLTKEDQKLLSTPIQSNISLSCSKIDSNKDTLWHDTLPVSSDDCQKLKFIPRKLFKKNFTFSCEADSSKFLHKESTKKEKRLKESLFTTQLLRSSCVGILNNSQSSKDILFTSSNYDQLWPASLFEAVTRNCKSIPMMQINNESVCSAEVSPECSENRITKCENEKDKLEGCLSFETKYKPIIFMASAKGKNNESVAKCDSFNIASESLFNALADSKIINVCPSFNNCCVLMKASDAIDTCVPIDYNSIQDIHSLSYITESCAQLKNVSSYNQPIENQLAKKMKYVASITNKNISENNVVNAKRSRSSNDLKSDITSKTHTSDNDLSIRSSKSPKTFSLNRRFRYAKWSSKKDDHKVR